MRRSAILESLQEETEAGARFLIGHSQGVKDLLLDILAMDADRARAELGSVQHDVIGQRSHRPGIGEQLAEILLMRRSERMMRGVPATILVVVFKHGKVCDPKKAIVIGTAGLVEGAVLFLVLLAQG